MNKRTSKSIDNFFDTFEKFIEVYLIIASICIFISFFYNLIIRSL
jgi:hypothetical protein